MQHQAQRIDIGCRSDPGGVGIKLLRAHITKRADELTRVGLQGRKGKVGVGGTRHAKVDHLRLTIPAHEDVARFEVAVHDPQPMTVGHRRRHAAQECHTLPHRQSVRPSELVYGKRMLDQFHHKERDRHAAVATGAECVDLRDVGMPQPRQQVRLLLEAFHDPAAGKAVPQDLHRDRPCGG